MKHYVKFKINEQRLLDWALKMEIQYRVTPTGHIDQVL